MLKECPLPLPRALPLPLSGIINFGLPPIVSIPLFHHFTFNILVYRSIAAITTIYLFLALLLPNLLYLVYLNILVIIIFFYLHGCTLLKCYLSFSYSGVPFQSAFYHIIAGFTLPHSSVTFSSPPLCCFQRFSVPPDSSRHIMRVDLYEKQRKTASKTIRQLSLQTCNATISVKQHQVFAQMMLPSQWQLIFFFKEGLDGGDRSHRAWAATARPSVLGHQVRSFPVGLPTFLPSTVRLPPSLSAWGKQKRTGSVSAFHHQSKE